MMSEKMKKIKDKLDRLAQIYNIRGLAFDAKRLREVHFRCDYQIGFWNLEVDAERRSSEEEVLLRVAENDVRETLEMLLQMVEPS
jgi:hypothetical protein